MYIKITDYETEGVDLGPGIRFIINCAEDGDLNYKDLEFSEFIEILNKIEYSISGITFNNVCDFDDQSYFLSFIKGIVIRRLNIRVTSNKPYEEVCNYALFKYINLYNDGREIDVSQSRKNNKVIKVR